ncbi:hypothetical protein [Kitasatospora sp. NPDC096204]|uniref:hypothetical protein n=1 Tax=Kitasatospora sp. NPDC096204 TaxID=3364094 RepID=UPI00381CF28E
MAYLALRGARTASAVALTSVLPEHSYSQVAGLNITADGVPLVEAADVRGFTITNRPPPLGSKKDDD